MIIENKEELGEIAIHQVIPQHPVRHSEGEKIKILCSSWVLHQHSLLQVIQKEVAERTVQVHHEEDRH